jgi:aspartate/methionine/tyrosine aminotransferase
LIPRDFFIEDRLEKYRLSASCNLGESGLRNFTVYTLLEKLGLKENCFNNISLADSPNNGREDLRKEIASLYENISPEQVLITTGTSEALYILFHLLIKKGDLVSLFTPAFQALYEIPLTLGASILEVDVIDSLPIEKIFSPKVNFAIINHPHNPTGIGLKKREIDFLKKALESYSGYTLFDEHYRFLDYENDLSFSGAGLSKKCFATGSITKCFGVTGLRIGWLIGDKEILEKARSFKDYLTHTVNPISEFLALEILRKRKEFVKPIKESILENVKTFSDNFKSLPGIENFRSPDGGLVSFVKLKDGISSEKYADLLLENCDIFVLPSSNFEREGFIRIGFGETTERFKDGIERWMNLKITTDLR